MEIFLIAGIPAVLVGLSRPAWLWLVFPAISFYANNLFGTRTLADIHSSKIPYGFLLAFTLVGFTHIVKSLGAHRRVFGRLPLVHACVFFLGISLVSLIDAVDVSRGVIFFGGWCCYILFFYIVVNSLSSTTSYKYFLIGNGLNAGICSLIMVFRSSITGFRQPADIWDLTWLTRNEIGFYFEPVIWICISILFFSKERFRWHAWLYVLLPLLLLTIVFAGTRGTWISLVASCAVMLLRFPMKQKMKASIAILALAFVIHQAVLMSEFAQERVTTFRALSEEDTGADIPRSSIPTRLYLMGIGWKMILDHPFNGVGLGNYSHHYHEYVPYVDDPSVRYIVSKPHTPHNFFLRFGAETGLPGVVAAVFLLFSVYRYLHDAIRTRHGEPWDSILLGCYLGFVANVVHCLLHEKIFAFYFWAFLGLVCATIHHAECASGQSSSPIDKGRPDSVRFKSVSPGDTRSCGAASGGTRALLLPARVQTRSGETND